MSKRPSGDGGATEMVCDSYRCTNTTGPYFRESDVALFIRVGWFSETIDLCPPCLEKLGPNRRKMTLSIEDTTVEVWPLRDVLSRVRPGDGWTWETESSALWHIHPDRMRELRDDIQRNGIREPIRVARTMDGEFRMWDGHHRVVLALEVGISEIHVRMESEEATNA